MGRGPPLCPRSSDVNLLGYGKGVIDFDAESVASAKVKGVLLGSAMRSLGILQAYDPFKLDEAPD